jgi:hypothetical protein
MIAKGRDIGERTNFSAPMIVSGAVGFSTTGVAAQRFGSAPLKPVKKMNGTSRLHMGSALFEPTRKSSTPADRA